MKLDKLENFCAENGIEYKINEPMSFHTSFKIGGPADIFITVSSEKQLVDVTNKAKLLEIPVFIIGKGSNLLVSDGGLEGAVINLSGMTRITIKDGVITCGAGAALSEICRVARDESLQGLEFAYGIPGSVGGALYMNAGAYGGEMSDVVSLASYLDKMNELKTVTVSNMSLGYRTSLFRINGGIITSVSFSLEKGDKKEITDKMNDFISRRQSKQPLEFPSAGSTFKRPEGYYAGALIEKNSLKGVSVGGCAVSEKHAGFLINKGGATCEDVKKLIKKVQETVLSADGVKLETEVIFVGRNITE